MSLLPNGGFESGDEIYWSDESVHRGETFNMQVYNHFA